MTTTTEVVAEAEVEVAVEVAVDSVVAEADMTDQTLKEAEVKEVEEVVIELKPTKRKMTVTNTQSPFTIKNQERTKRRILSSLVKTTQNSECHECA